MGMGMGMGRSELHGAVGRPWFTPTCTVWRPTIHTSDPYFTSLPSLACDQHEGRLHVAHEVRWRL